MKNLINPFGSLQEKQQFDMIKLVQKKTVSNLLHYLAQKNKLSQSCHGIWDKSNTWRHKLR